MHHIYTTPSFVIHSRPHGEAGKYLLLFTKDFGMLGAVAQGIRLSHSKLRYHAQDYSFSNMSLVRGKEVWRITGIKEFTHEVESISNKENKKIYVKILQLLKRLLSGEEKNQKLFEVIEELHRFLAQGENERREFVEYVTVWRILFHLGYISKKEEFAHILESDVLDEATLDEVKAHKPSILKEINNALKESQL